ncbi:MotA/TolQ/ExbB proton channel family protein [Pelomonas sp. UHG3]|jgi:biopolymer transport protein ExbB|uniref:MotA/TolQ/ExbB proton channel family protein n=1 Tax=Roseateles hydrophilus TaxID=2975054 RepID=A0ACC6C8S9_9BURK|nr:MotA/TolQ/ExbB proton channel family protein [Pelomonas sp. UHG3]MCY4744807.1 MotA/TolQ/ExbB proton channel family protein [Pelomonas sp. UHG3]
MDATAITAAAPAPGFGHFIAQSDAVGKFLLGALVLMSVISWGLIIAKGVSQFLRNKRSTSFLDFFWNARSLDAVQAELNTHGAHDPFSHLSAHALHAQAHHARYGAAKLSEAGTATDFITRTIKKVLDEETTRLESGLTTLATVGATAPFVGLFGTVWGVYHALLAIGMSGAGTLDKVAGPVGEALIMTGIGLAVAIPAVIAYNAFTRSNRVLSARLDAFAYELHSFLTLGEAPGAAAQTTTVRPLKPAAAH